MGELLPRWKLTRDTGKMQFCILGWRARRDPSTLQKKIFPPAFEDGRKSALDFSALAFGPFHSLALTHCVAVPQPLLKTSDAENFCARDLAARGPSHTCSQTSLRTINHSSAANVSRPQSTHWLQTMGAVGDGEKTWFAHWIGLRITPVSSECAIQSSDHAQ